MSVRAIPTPDSMPIADTVADLLVEFVSTADQLRRALLTDNEEEFAASFVRLLDARRRTIQFARARCTDVLGGPPPGLDGRV